MMKTADWTKYQGRNGSSRRVRALNSRLEKVYGPFRPFKRLDGVEELIVTVLSQNTNDVNRDRAYSSLIEKFPKWDDVLNAPVGEIERAIRVGGLAHNKSRAIKKILGEIRKRFGKFTLDPIAKLPINEAIEELTKLPSVGKKTAACVLVFSYGRPVIPVDTHVHRVVGRLGIVGHPASREATFEALSDVVPRGKALSLHVNLVRHGRAVCRARSPRCGACVLARACGSGGRARQPRSGTP